MIRVPCSYCGKEVRRQKRRKRVTCFQCNKKNNNAKTREWNAAHKAEVDTGKYWRNHPAERIAYMREYREKNRTHLRLYARLYARRAYRKNKQLLADLPCDDCGMKHTPERRAAILRRMLPCHTSDVHAAWGCIWGPAGAEHRSSAGAKMLQRDLHGIGALSHGTRGGWYELPQASAA